MTRSALRMTISQVPGSPFLCRVRDGDCGSVGEADYSEGGHVTVELEHLASIAVAQPAEFTIRVPEVWLFCGPFFSFLAFSVLIYFQHFSGRGRGAGGERAGARGGHSRQGEYQNI